MLKQLSFQRFMCQFLSALLILGSVQSAAFAGIVTSENLAHTEQIQQQRDQIKSWFARDDVRDALIAKGVDPSDALERVDRLTDAEVAMMHEQFDQLPAGEGALEAVLIVLLILILLDITGVTDIFPRI